ncbi:MAG: DUF5916 domain-containing protein [Gemmatimonadales bacterium]
MITWCAGLAMSLLLPPGMRVQDTLRLVFTVQPSTTPAETTIRPAVQVAAQDGSGQTLTRFTGEVTLEVTPPAGDQEGDEGVTLSGTTRVAAVDGVATFSDLAFDDLGAGYTLTAMADGFADARSAAFDVTGGGIATGGIARADGTGGESTDGESSGGENVGGENVGGERSGGERTGGDAASPDSASRDTASGELTSGENPSAESLDDESASEDEARPQLHVAAFHTEFTLDGRLDEPWWATADSIAGLVTTEPEEGGVSAAPTTVKVLASPGELVFGIVCRDPEAVGLVAFAKTRDFDLELEDHVVLVLDPFRDGRSGYVFAVNPNGARFDGLVSAQGEEVNTDWDGIWEAATSRDGRGWSAEIRIPIKTLSFKQGLTGWGFNVERRVQRLQETSRWAGANRDYEIYQTSHAGVLADLPAFDLGLGLSIRPSLVGNASKPAPDEDRTYDSDISLDATKRLGPNLVASLTVNTDFAETEVDARQTNLTRFDLLFPEKRTFFLEGADIFEFGFGTGEDVIPFHSRRIGLQGEEEDLLQIPLRVGGKLNGRIGNTNVAALALRTGRADTLGTNATMGVVRVKQNILAESSVGMIATAGDPLRLPGSWMGGVDFTYQTSEFRGDKNFLVGAWGLRNHRDDLGGASAFGGMIDYPNDLWDLALAYKHIGEDFNPSLSFVPRTGVQIWQMEAAFTPRPGWPLVRQMFFEFDPSLVTDLHGRWESYLISMKPLDWKLESGDRFEFDIEPEGDRPTEDFELFGSDTKTVSVPAGTYRWTRYTVQGELAAKRKINGEVTGSVGSFYGGNLKSLALTLRVKPSAFVAAELGWERNSAQLPDGDFVQQLYSGRLQVNVSADLQLASFLQYDNESRNLGTNTRLRWTFDPLGELFVVFNHNLQRDLTDRFGFDSNQLLVKLQYAYRL